MFSSSPSQEKVLLNCFVAATRVLDEQWAAIQRGLQAWKREARLFLLEGVASLKSIMGLDGIFEDPDGMFVSPRVLQVMWNCCFVSLSVS